MLLVQLLGPDIAVSPTVVVEIRNYVDWTRRDVQRRARLRPESVAPSELTWLEHLERWERRLRSPAVHRLDSLDEVELETVAYYLGDGRLDPGESEALAIAKHRGRTIVIDEFVGHCCAESEHIPNTSTLGVLVEAVINKQLDEAGQPTCGAASRSFGIMLCLDRLPIICSVGRSGLPVEIEVHSSCDRDCDQPVRGDETIARYVRYVSLRFSWLSNMASVLLATSSAPSPEAYSMI